MICEPDATTFTKPDDVFRRQPRRRRLAQIAAALIIRPGEGGALFERLEQRALLAGNVSAELIGQTLHLRGDGDHNQVVITRAGDLPSRAQVRVHDGTTINGITQLGGFFSGRFRSVRMSGGGGDDQLTVENVKLPGGVVLDGASGSDQLLIRKAKIGFAAELRGGRGNDTLAVRGSVIGGQFFIPQTTGEDSISLRDSHFANDLLIGDKRGRTTFSARRIVVDGRLQVTTGAAGDVLTMTDCVVYGTSDFKTGAGDDVVRIAGSEFKQATSLDDGDGDDRVYREVVRRFDFDKGEQGWQTYAANWFGFDVPFRENDGRIVLSQDVFRLDLGIRSLPEELPGDRRGFKLSGDNLTDELFLFIGRQFGSNEGVSPKTLYRFRFDVQLATRVPIESAGALERLIIGGISRPIQVTTVDGDSSPYVRLIGSDGNRADQRDDIHRAVNRIEHNEPRVFGRFLSVFYGQLTLPFPVASDAQGKVSLLTGVFSSFEGGFATYLQRLRVTLVPDDSGVQQSTVTAEPNPAGGIL